MENVRELRAFLGLVFLSTAFLAAAARAADQPYSIEAGSITAPAEAPLSIGATEQAEPYVSPLGAKKTQIVSGFGQREVPGTPGKVEKHEGIDYSVTPGMAVRAARSGKVLFAGFSTAYVSRTDKTDKHRLVIVRHADNASSRYVHLNTIAVRPGQPVVAGTVLGTAAESDEWTEPVLHFEIRDPAGRALDPEEILNPAPPK